MVKKPRILVIDDGIQYAKVIKEQMPEFSLVKPGNQSKRLCISDGPSALKFLKQKKEGVDLVLLDMHFDVPEKNLLPLDESTSLKRTRRFQGVAILREIRRLFPGLPVVLLTALEDLSLLDADRELASQSMTYFLDSEDLDALRIQINQALKEAALNLEESDILWGEDPGIRAMRRRMNVLARGAMPIILEGETGTGKSFLAERFIYKKSGRKGPFVVLDMASIPRDLIPAHLFGAQKGAYTGSVADRKGIFELAHRGVLFIDEVQNVPLEAQKQLLLVLQDGRVRPLGATKEVAVDVKVVAATNSRLDHAVANGQFRQDLYMRLSPATRVVIPPLRDHLKDLLFFAERFVARAVEDPDIAMLRDQVSSALGMGTGTRLSLVVGRKRKQPKTELQLMLPEPVWKMMQAYHWPGNIRELDTVMRNIVTFTLVAAVDAIQSGITIKSQRLQVASGLVVKLVSSSVSTVESKKSDLPSDAIPIQIKPEKTLNAVSNAVERQYLLKLFQETKGDFSNMARLLLGDSTKARAVRLRFNQLGLKVKDIS